MRLWHYKLIPFLPKSQLLAQWRELNSIFKKQDKHILIDYIYLYSRHDLYIYSNMVIEEMKKRNIAIHSWESFNAYFCHEIDYFKNILGMDNPIYRDPFKNHHDDLYLIQCFYNLQEKYIRGQKDFTSEQYHKLHKFCSDNLGFELIGYKQLKTCRVL